MKTILEFTEKTLVMILSVSACMGMFLMGVFALGLFREVSTDEMWYIFLVSAVLTFLMTRLWESVRFRRLSILAEELENSSEEADRLYKHLEVR